MKLQLREIKEGNLNLTISPWFRVSLLIISAVIAGAMITSPAAGPLIFFLLALFGALYEERWVFSSTGIESRHGLIMFSRKERWKAEDLEGLFLSSFTKGKSTGTSPGSLLLPSYAVLSFTTVEGEKKTLEVLPLRKKQELNLKGVRIAERCGISFMDET